MWKWRFKHWRCTSKCSHNKEIEDESLQCKKKSNLNSSINLSFQETNAQETLKSEAATRGVLCKKVFFEISQNSQENTCARVSFYNKVAGLRSIAGLTRLQCHFVKIFSNSFILSRVEKIFFKICFVKLSFYFISFWWLAHSK